MRRLIMMFSAIFFIFYGIIFAAEATKTTSALPVVKSEIVSAKVDPSAITVKEMGKEPKMSAIGKVTEITDTMLKIDRYVKGNTESMEFLLEKACYGISVGDQVETSYITGDDRNVAVKVAKMQKKTKHHVKNKTVAKE